MKHAITLFCLVLTAGCSGQGLFRPGAMPADAVPQTRPVARPDALSGPPPPPDARTEEQFDTTSAEARAAAAQAPVQAEVSLGTTIASLGDPTRPGFWLETPLVTAQVKGRVVYSPTGKSARVELIPIEGPVTAGSRLSLPAMRLIGAPLTDLPEIQVFSIP